MIFSRLFLPAFAALTLSACVTTGSHPMSSCCCDKMKHAQAGDEKAGCCAKKEDSKKECGCCGGDDGKPMTCAPKE